MVIIKMMKITNRLQYLQIAQYRPMLFKTFYISRSFICIWYFFLDSQVDCTDTTSKPCQHTTTQLRMLDNQTGLELLSGVLNNLSYTSRVLPEGHKSRGTDVKELHRLLLKRCIGRAEAADSNDNAGFVNHTLNILGAVGSWLVPGLPGYIWYRYWCWS